VSDQENKAIRPTDDVIMRKDLSEGMVIDAAVAVPVADGTSMFHTQQDSAVQPVLPAGESE
jgi:hypothetical protein